MHKRVQIGHAMTNRKTILKDFFNYLKTDLSNNIEDPLPDRGTSNFIMTSYPQRQVKYPLITIKVTNLEAPRSGMQNTNLNITITAEIRVWARNEKEKDELYSQILDRLAENQFIGDGSIDNEFHDFNVLSSIEIDEPGESGIKSRIMQLRYKTYAT